jgi:hypothetical protein
MNTGFGWQRRAEVEVGGRAAACSTLRGCHEEQRGLLPAGTPHLFIARIHASTSAMRAMRLPCTQLSGIQPHKERPARRWDQNLAETATRFAPAAVHGGGGLEEGGRTYRLDLEVGRLEFWVHPLMAREHQLVGLGAGPGYVRECGKQAPEASCGSTYEGLGNGTTPVTTPSTRKLDAGRGKKNTRLPMVARTAAAQLMGVSRSTRPRVWHTFVRGTRTFAGRPLLLHSCRRPPSCSACTASSSAAKRCGWAPITAAASRRWRTPCLRRERRCLSWASRSPDRAPLSTARTARHRRLAGVMMHRRARAQGQKPRMLRTR